MMTALGPLLGMQRERDHLRKETVRLVRANDEAHNSNRVELKKAKLENERVRTDNDKLM